MLLSAALLLSLFPTSMAQAQDAPRLLRVGYIDYENFIQPEDAGGFSGYCVEYLRKLSTYTGWAYEFVYDTWENHMANLKNGSLDLLCQAQRTPEREENYLFSTYSSGAESSLLYVRPEDDRYYYNDYSAFNGMRIGLLEGSFQNQELQEYARRNGFTYTAVLYTSSLEAFAALDDGQVDGVAMGSLAMQPEYRSVCRFGSDPFYFITGLQNTELMFQLDDALSQLKAADPNLENRLYQKYYGAATAKASISFTREEAELIKQGNTYQVALIPNRAPFSYVNEQGEPAGITRSLMDLIARRSGLHFSYVMLEPGQQVPPFLASNPDAFVAGIMTENPAFRDNSFLVSDIFYTDDVALACLTTTSYDLSAAPGAYRLALPRSYGALQTLVTADHPEFSITLCQSTEECARLVMNGEADFMAQNVNVITPLIQNPHYDQLTILPSFFMEETTGIVTTADPQHKLLMSIINQCISSITSVEKAQFTVDESLNNGYKPSAGDMLYKFRMPLFVIAVLLLLLAIAMYSAGQLRRSSYQKLAVANRQLAAAAEKAEQADSAKTRFLAQMSHEIRTPMNAIIGLTSIARKQELSPDKLSEYWTKIDNSSRLLLSIINDVLDMSAIEGGKMKIDSQPFDFNRLLSNLFSMFYQQARQKGVDLRLHLNGLTQETLIGDELRTNQILMNLLSNAVKFTPGGGQIDLSVTQASASQSKVQLRFQVKDNGCGMSRDMLERLFLPFEQESASTARKHGGSGLGLSIVKNLTEMMGGSIHAQSESNKGTTFTVDIPFGKSEEQISHDRSLFTNIRALVVDDDEDSCEYCEEILERLNVRHGHALRGEQALEMLGEAEDLGDPYKLCLLDWRMPEMDGIEVARNIRQIFGSDILIIMLSAYDLNEIPDEQKALYANSYISKPLFQSTLVNSLMRVLGDEAVEKALEARTNASYDFSGKRVLIAEDVALNMEVAVSLLKMVKAEAVCAEDGQQAVNLFRSAPGGYYDCILMDINMPVMDGYEAARSIRASDKPDARTIPIFAMTANAFATDITAALDAGMNGHIAKPIETEALYQALEQAFRTGDGSQDGGPEKP